MGVNELICGSLILTKVKLPSLICCVKLKLTHPSFNITRLARVKPLRQREANVVGGVCVCVGARFMRRENYDRLSIKGGEGIAKAQRDFLSQECRYK